MLIDFILFMFIITCYMIPISIVAFIICKVIKYKFGLDLLSEEDDL